MSQASPPIETAEALRRSFDRSFTEAPMTAAERPEEFLAIRAGGDGYAVRLAQTSGLTVDRKVVTLPSPAPELLGIVGLRGNISPVYDLGAFLGYPRGEAGRWLLLVGQTERIGLAFAEFEGHFQVFQRDLALQEETRPLQEHVWEAVRVGEVLRPIINLASIVEAIKRRAGSAGPTAKGEANDGS